MKKPKPKILKGKIDKLRAHEIPANKRAPIPHEKTGARKRRDERRKEKQKLKNIDL